MNKVNARVNFGYLIILATLGFSGISLHEHLSKPKEIYTLEDELRDAGVVFGEAVELHPNTSSIKLDFSEVENNKENNIDFEEVINSINEPINQTSTEINNIAEKLFDSINKNYSGMKLDHEYEDYLKELCHKYSEEYNIDYDTLYKSLLTIGYQESAGEWNNNGIESDSHDLGVFQINRVNLGQAKELFGYSADDILNDKYKNADYATYILCAILNNSHCHNMEDVFGMYNGWVGWETKPLAVKYSASCMNIMNEYFGEYTQSISK